MIIHIIKYVHDNKCFYIMEIYVNYLIIIIIYYKYITTELFRANKVFPHAVLCIMPFMEGLTDCQHDR